MSVTVLTNVFAKLGARNPAAWARSQATEGIPQLARFLFLRQAWQLVVAEGDRAWIEEQTNVDQEGPGGGIAAALNRALLCGISEQDLTTIVRVMQWKLLSELCCLLDDPGDVEDEVKDIAWRLFQIDEDGKPIAAMTGLHESVLETEPPGREMRSN